MTINLTFDVIQQKSGLVGVINTRLFVAQNLQALLSANLRELAFQYQDIPNKTQVLNAVKHNLDTSQTNALQWENDLIPRLNFANQAYVNVATTFLKIIEKVRIEYNKEEKSNTEAIIEYFEEGTLRITQEIEQLEIQQSEIETAIVTALRDGQNFSNANAPFATLFDADKEQIEAAEQVLAQVQSKIKILQKQVDDQTINKEVPVDYQAISMNAASVIFDSAPISALNLSIDIFGIVSTGLALQQLQAQINELFSLMKQAAADELVISLLTQQLLALLSVRRVTEQSPNALTATKDSLTQIINNLTSIQAPFKQIILSLKNMKQVNTVLDLFELGAVNEQFNEMLRFSSNAQSLSLNRGSKLALIFPQPQN